MKKKNKVKSKAHPYTKESLGKKIKILKILVSLLESLILTPIVDALLTILNTGVDKKLLLITSYFLTLFVLYISKSKSNKYEIRKLELLDDEVKILTDRKLDGEVKDLYVNKFFILIGLNIFVIAPLSLTFSAILSGGVSLILGLFLEEKFVELIKFILIAIIFSNFFKPSNSVLIKYLDEKKELF